MILKTKVVRKQSVSNEFIYNFPYLNYIIKDVPKLMKTAEHGYPLGHPTLSWIMRVQIALDTARGLEYIHEHTKPHYVHRDIKTSNILLDSAFKAKVSIRLFIVLA